MPIKLSITLSSGGRFKPVAIRTLDDPRITIGRDEDCTLTLEDTQKHVSRVHAELEQEGDSYWMKVVSRVNPVVVNGKRLMFGDRVVLAEGDTMAIGLYRLEVQRPETAAAAAPAAPQEPDPDLTYVRPARTPATAPPVKPPPPPAAEEATYVPRPMAPPPPPKLPVEPVQDEEATYVPAPATPPAPAPKAPPPPPAASMDPMDRVAQRIAQFRKHSETTQPSAAAAPEAAAGLDFDLSELETLVPQAPAAAAPPPAPAPPAAEDLSEQATLYRPPAEEAFDDEATMVRRPGTPPPPRVPVAPPPPVEEPFDDEATMVRRPGPIAPPPAPARAAPAPARPRAAQSSGDPAVDAFLEGAGLSHLAIADPQAFMRASGALVRAAVEGLMMLMLARAETRREIGAEASDTEAADNPLRTLTSPDEIIAFLFDPRRPAVPGSDPVHALGEMCSDLRAHQVALSAAMKAAVAGAVTRLDPKVIEREHGKSLGGLNLTRKSKLWDLSIEQHEKLAQEMLGDFGSAFGKEILAAYTAQVRKARGR